MDLINKIPLNIYDLSILAYITWGWIRGRKRKIATELKSLITLLFFAGFLLGLSLFSHFREVIESILELTSLTQSVFFRWSFGLAGGLYLIYFIRHRFAHAVEEELSEEKKSHSGAIIGLIRNLIFCVLLTILCYFSFNMFTTIISESVVGSVITSAYTNFNQN